MQINDAIDLIKDDISRVEEEFRKNLTSDVYLIRRIGEYILGSGGKRFRPLMLLLSARLCGYTGSSHIPLSAVVEFIHTATLLHDDVVDNAEIRRGSESANTLWGNGASVLVGDYLLAKAFYIAVAEGDLRILDVLADTTTRLAEGEVLQLLKHSDAKATENEYLKVITNKTAVLFSASCQVAAILGGVSKDKEQSLAGFGMGVGIAYQLVDDCLDYTSKDEELGKPVGNDLREGKVTLPLIKAYRDCTGVERRIITDAVEADETDPATIEKIFALINRYHGIDYTMEMARARIEDAKRSIEAFEPNVERAAMLAVADHMIKRTH